MRFYSPCARMVSDAQSLPDGACVKLFMRHSIRYDNPVDGDYTPLMLTPEGIALARRMGQSVDRPLGSCMASTVPRCPQTVRAFVSGMDESLVPGRCAGGVAVSVHDELAWMLGDPRAQSFGGVGWFEYFHYLQTGDTGGTRGVTLSQEAARILDCVFSEGGRAGTLDVICSHDSHVIVLASALFGLRTGLDGHDWCGYTEGLFLYGTREDFTALWRGEERRFEGAFL